MAKRISSSDEEDHRYTEFLEGDSTSAVVGKVFVTQGLAQLLVAVPIQVAAVTDLPKSWRRWLFPAGMVIAIGGAVVEAVADRQKDHYKKRDGDKKPPVLDTGLWGWSRHPNYFGDSLVWDGIWLAAAASSPGQWTVFSPAAMSYFLIFATGAKRTEERMQDRPGFRDYQRRVPLFFPKPPSS